MQTEAENLLAMMDLDADVPEAAGGDDPVSGDAKAPQGPPPAEHVLKLDNWGKRRGLELVRDEQTRAACGIEGPPPEAQPDGSDAPHTDEEVAWGRALADLHGAAFEPDLRLNPKCQDELREQFVNQLVETPDFQEMRQNTVLNPAAAEIATAAFAKQYAVRVAEAKRDKAQGKGGPDGDILTMKAAAAACAAASKAVGDFKDACDMTGLGTPQASGKLDRERMAKLFKRVRTSPNLAKIAKLAGRFRRLAQSKQRQKVVHGADEVVGVTMGDEIGRLVPAELVKLVDPTFALDTTRRLLEKQTLVRETKATEPVGKGPIVVVVDESGSMGGQPIETAKAFALALAWIARKQKRWCVLVSFSHGAEIEVPGGECVLPPNRPNEEALLNWLEHFYGGGTCLDVPLGAVPARWPEYVKQGMARGKTDLIVITDGEMRLPDELKASFLGFKAAEKCKLTTICIGCSAGPLEGVSDHVHKVAAITTESEAVGEVLSI